MGERSKGRWSIMQALRANQDVKHFLPDIALCKERAFVSFLQAYDHVVLKPCYGERPFDWLWVKRLENHLYRVRTSEEEVDIAGATQVYEYISNLPLLNKHYILQADRNWPERYMVKIVESEPVHVAVLTYKRGAFCMKECLEYKEGLPDLCREVGETLASCYSETKEVFIEVGCDGETIGIEEVHLGLLKQKWTLYGVMAADPIIVSHLPQTLPCTLENVREWMEPNRAVLFKPSKGQGGRGIASIERVKRDKFLVQVKQKQFTFHRLSDAYSFVKRNVMKLSHYMIQPRLALMQYNGLPFDVRVMVQREKDTGQWIATGSLLRVANDGYITTNVTKHYLESHTVLTEETIQSINQLALRTAYHLSRYYADARAIGYDIGVDQKGEIWIIEANFVPDFSLFKQLDDLSMYQEMLKHGRKKRLLGED